MRASFDSHFEDTVSEIIKSLTWRLLSVCHIKCSLILRQILGEDLGSKVAVLSIIDVLFHEELLLEGIKRWLNQPVRRSETEVKGRDPYSKDHEGRWKEDFSQHASHASPITVPSLDEHSGEVIAERCVELALSQRKLLEILIKRGLLKSVWCLGSLDVLRVVLSRVSLAFFLDSFTCIECSQRILSVSNTHIGVNDKILVIRGFRTHNRWQEASLSFVRNQSPL